MITSYVAIFTLNIKAIDTNCKFTDRSIRVYLNFIKSSLHAVAQILVFTQDYSYVHDV